MSPQRHRLAAGGRIDRSRPLNFTFNGRRFEGYAGDTLASALIANGVTPVARSFKYHRPRGIVGAGAEEPNAIVQLETGARTQPNQRATRVELYDGLTAASVNCWPSVNFDLGAVNNLLKRLLPAGFYYKTFMWPPGFWMRYEYFIRRAAGLGKAPAAPDPDRYDKMHCHADVLVVGGGPSGLAAALAAGRTGARVILADGQNEFGGALLDGGAEIDGGPALDWVAAAVAELEAMAEVRLLPRATVAGYYDHNYLTIVERVTDHLGAAAPANLPRQRLWKVRAGQVVLATGSVERPLVFADNDRPGIMLASAAATYVNRYAAKPGSRAVVFTNNDSAYRVALDLAEAGIEVAAVVDPRPEPEGPLPARTRARGIEVLGGQAVVAAHGGGRVAAVEVMGLDQAGGGVIGESRRVRCDLVCVSGGWNPTVHLFSQSGGRLRYDDALAGFVPDRSAQAERSVGAAAGTFALADCLARGFEAGLEAAAEAGFRRKGRSRRAPKAPAQEEAPLRPFWVVPSTVARGRGTKHFIDLQNDVTVADVALAVREGYRSAEHLKRYTTMGMGTDQGKIGNVTGLAVLSELVDADIPSVGTTTFRPPYTPVGFGLLAGREVGALADPVRKTAIHRWHEDRGAAFEDVGQWKRPWYFPRAGESMHDAVNRECLAVRNSVGVMDASTLGKIDIQGPDALRLLNWVYTNAWDNLKIGRCRYGLMLGEDGMVMDDGVTTRLAEHHYLMTTTTGGAAGVLAWLEMWLQTEWLDLKVHLTSVTEHWATVAVAGPRARELLSALTSDIDLSAKAFPFMSMRAGTVAGVPARVFRISFTGELSFEINVPASYGMAVWNAVMMAGEKYGVTPFGTEAMHILRAEKGYIIVGDETDGTTTPGDVGMDWIVSKKKPDFIGKRSLSRPDTAREGRKQLVGLLTQDPKEVLPEGGQIVAEPEKKPPMKMIGHVTSSYWSASLGRSIALALVYGGHKRHGETVHVPLIGKTVSAVVSEPRFYDPEGVRLRG